MLQKYEKWLSSSRFKIAPYIYSMIFGIIFALLSTMLYNVSFSTALQIMCIGAVWYFITAFFKAIFKE